MVHHRPSAFRRVLIGVMFGVAGACSGGSGGGSGDTLPVGTFGAKPDGAGFYVADPHQSGQATRLRLVELTWGRLVDVHSVDASGAELSEPVLRDFVVNENVQSDPDRWRLETNPVTQRTRLVVLRERGAPDLGGGTFESLLHEAASRLPGVLPKGDWPSQVGPFSYWARNATLVLRFDDLLDDDATALRDLVATVRVRTGYPPERPFEARILFDANHGGVVGGAFHSTRVLVDPTVSDSEAADAPVSLPVNAAGLPRSQEGGDRPNVSIRLPTRVDPAVGQFAILRGLSGSELTSQGNGPVDPESPTRDLVRALRAGNETDTNNGFLLDFDAPSLVGAWPCSVSAAEASDATHLAWSLDLLFATVCSKDPEPGDLVVLGENFVEVTEGRPLAANGTVDGLPVRVLNRRAPSVAGELIGLGSYQTLYRIGVPVPDGCWIRFMPAPRVYPAESVPPDALTTLRFSEPIDPSSVLPFDTVLQIRGRSSEPPSPTNHVVGNYRASADLREFTFEPSTPYAHGGDGTAYHVILRRPGVTDLAGNELRDALPELGFTIEPAAELERNGSVVLRFESPDELDPIGAPDVRGQFTYDFSRALIRPRPVFWGSDQVDRSSPVVSIMPRFGPGVATPLSPLGSRLHAVWRYTELGWSIRDESKYNLDVTGLYWSPARGQVVSDFFDQFEIVLGHSRWLPDEQPRAPTTGGVKYTLSGLVAAPGLFSDNPLIDPLGMPRLMHPRTAGYRIDPADLSVAPTGTPVLPFPINRTGGPLVTYTWRDTAVLAKGGYRSAGVPLDIEVGVPLFLEQEIGSFAGSARVPSVGLPLLMEFRCFPSPNSIGLNPLAVHIANNSSAAPNFRAYSTGGINVAGQPVTKNPDLELSPSGGLNPNSRPPGKPTLRTADNTIYLGQLDYVVRLSRVHTIWIDTLALEPHFTGFVVEPRSIDQPSGTRLEVEFRGADDFVEAFEAPFDARALDPYGDPRTGSVVFHDGDGTWKSDPAEVNGARFVQMRFTFFNNLDAGLNPELSAIGLAYTTE
jgi:hypothetical protein